MNRLLAIIGVPAIALWLCVSANAQKAGEPGEVFGWLHLLHNPEVAQELKVSPEQAGKLREVAQQLRDKHKNAFQKLQDLQGDERRQKQQELMKTIAEDSRKALPDVLKPDQVKRFKQIEMQHRGVRAFMDPELHQSLKLTDDQKQKIHGVNEEFRKKVQELHQGVGDDPQKRAEALKKRAAMNKEVMEKIAAMFTEEQKKTWKDLAGEPFELKQRE